MPRFIRKHKVLAGAVALISCTILLSVLWSVSTSARGRLVARYDVSRGHYEVLGYGLPVPWRPEYARLLKERYGVEFRTVALCIVSRDLVAYADSYNRVSSEAINRKFSHDVFKECSEEAREKWEGSRKLMKSSAVKSSAHVL